MRGCLPSAAQRLRLSAGLETVTAALRLGPPAWGGSRGGWHAGACGHSKARPSPGPLRSLQVQPPGDTASADHPGPGRSFQSHSPSGAADSAWTRTTRGVPAPGRSRPVPVTRAGPSLLDSLLLGHKGTAHTGVGSGPGHVGGGDAVAPGALAGGVSGWARVDQPEAGDQRMKMFLKGDPRPGTRGIRRLMWGRRRGTLV